MPLDTLRCADNSRKRLTHNASAAQTSEEYTAHEAMARCCTVFCRKHVAMQIGRAAAYIGPWYISDDVR